MTTGTVKQQAIAETPKCSLISAELTTILYALERAGDTLRKTAYVYIATKSKEALSGIEKWQRVGSGREVVPNFADAVLEMKSVGPRVTVFLVPWYGGIRGVTDGASELTAAPAERVHKLSGVLRLVKAERSKSLHTNEDDTCVEYHTWKVDKAWSGKHTLCLYGTLSSDETSI